MGIATVDAEIATKIAPAYPVAGDAEPASPDGQSGRDANDQHLGPQQRQHRPGHPGAHRGEVANERIQRGESR